MEMLTYKGYVGSADFSEKDHIFYGKIENIKGFVNYEGDGFEELIEAFHQAVENYLEYCENEGITPD